MKKSSFAAATFLALCAALGFAPSAHGQGFGVGGKLPGSYGYGGYGGYGGGYGGGFNPFFNQGYGGYAPGSSFYNPGFSSGYGAPGLYGSYYSTPGYPGYYQYQGGMYNYPTTGVPYSLGSSYYYGGNPAASNLPKTSSYSSLYSAVPNIQISTKLDKAGTGGTSVRVKVSDPEAEVWFGSVKTKQTGLEREFVTPVLEPGKSYKYEVRATWTEKGVAVERSQTVTFTPGQNVVIDFTQPAASEKQPEKKPSKTEK